MVQTRSDNRGRDRGRGRSSEGRVGGRTYGANKRTTPTTPSVETNTGNGIPHHTSPIQKKDGGTNKTLQPTAPGFQPAITIMQNPSAQGSNQGTITSNPGQHQYRTSWLLVPYTNCCERIMPRASLLPSSWNLI
jgi:hypothetical protein